MRAAILTGWRENLTIDRAPRSAATTELRAVDGPAPPGAAIITDFAA